MERKTNALNERIEKEKKRRESKRRRWKKRITRKTRIEQDLVFLNFTICFI